MRARKKFDPTLLRAEVRFDDRTGTIEIVRTDPAHRRQRLSCTFEQWEQIKYAVEHLFTGVSLPQDGWEEIRDVANVAIN